MDNRITAKEYEALNTAVTEHLKNGVIKSKCPRCGRSLIYEASDSLEIIRCEDTACVKSIRRGV